VTLRELWLELGRVIAPPRCVVAGCVRRQGTSGCLCAEHELELARAINRTIAAARAERAGDARVAELADRAELALREFEATR
jgi:hypothetical protein